MITVQVTTDEITAALTRAADALDDLDPLLRDIGEYLVRATNEGFVQGQAPDGTPWASRSQATLDAYRARGDTPGPGPLIGPSRSLSTTISYEVEGDAITWGSNMIYAAVMQMGATRGQFGSTSRGSPIPWGDIPPRPFLGVGPEDEAAILDIVAEALGL